MENVLALVMIGGGGSILLFLGSVSAEYYKEATVPAALQRGQEQSARISLLNSFLTQMVNMAQQ